MAAITPTAGKSHSAGMCWPTDALLAYLCPFYTACVPVLSHTSGLSVSFLHSLCASADTHFWLICVLSTQPVCQCCLCPFYTACVPVLSEEFASSVALYHCCVSLPAVCVCVCTNCMCVCVCVPTVCVCECTCSLCMHAYNVDWRECMLKVQAVRGVWLSRSHQFVCV